MNTERMLKFEQWVDKQLNMVIVKIPFLGLKMSTRHVIYTIIFAGVAAGLTTLADRWVQHYLQ